MQAEQLVGLVLLVGMVCFLVGAGGWRLAYEQPLTESLRVIHEDRFRRAWIHVWMIVAMLLTPAGVVALVVVTGSPTARAATLVAATVYALGAAGWIVSLAFRLTVVPWAAERTVATGEPPDGFAALDRWAGSLYVIHMVASYLAFAILGGAVLAAGDLAPWTGWVGVGIGLGFLTGFVATRFAGFFNPPFWAHTYTGMLGVVLLVS